MNRETLDVEEGDMGSKRKTAVAHPERVRASDERRVGTLHRQERFLTALWNTPVSAVSAALVAMAILWSCSDDRFVDIEVNDKTPPAAITDLCADSTFSGAVRLRWTATGDDSMTGQAAAYDIRYSTDEIDSSNWAGATKCAGVPAPKVAGSDESFLVSGLQPKTRYRFAAKVADEVPNWSAICDGATALTPDTVVITWAKTFGGPESENDARAIVAVDSGFIFAGNTYSYSFGWADFYVVKTNDLGDSQWRAHYGTSVGENLNGLCTTHDRGYLLVGLTGDAGSFQTDGVLLKLDADGQMLWWKTYGFYIADSTSPISYSGDCIFGVAPVPGGGYVVTFEGGWLMNVDEMGDSVWTRRYYGVGFTEAYSVAAADDGSYVVAGRTGDGQQGGAYVYKVSSAGDLIWDRAFSFGANSWFAYSICIAPDGYVMVGFSTDGTDAVVAKVDEAGGLLWEKRFGGPNYERINAVCCAANAGYVVAGGTNAFDEGEDVYLFKVDDSGNLLWERTYGGTLNDRATSIALCKDGGFIVAATTHSYGQKSQIWLLKLDSEGRLFE